MGGRAPRALGRARRGHAGRNLFASRASFALARPCQTWPAPWTASLSAWRRLVASRGGGNAPRARGRARSRRVLERRSVAWTREAAGGSLPAQNAREERGPAPALRASSPRARRIANHATLNAIRAARTSWSHSSARQSEGLITARAAAQACEGPLSCAAPLASPMSLTSPAPPAGAPGATLRCLRAVMARANY